MTYVQFTDLAETEQALVRAAERVRENAYSPYSQHKVGAAVLARSGRIYTGCNVERVTLSLSTHAERNAIDAMVAGGDRELVTLCCFGSYSGIPCAECRQAIWEFAGGDGRVKIIATGPKGQIAVMTMAELYPYPYGPETKGIDPHKF